MPSARTALLPVAVLALLALVAWSALVLVAALSGWGRSALAAEGDTAAFFTAARARIEAESRGNAVLVVLRDGDVVGEAAVSIGTPVDRDTAFPVASVSKWLTAVGVLTLVDAGKLELDAPVSRYLTRWQLPAGPHDARGVTIRRLLAHTAGLTDGLGYRGFAADEPLQPLEASLTRASDASPGADGRVRVGAPPGSAWRYSGGGYTLLQLVVEEASGQPFEQYMQRAVFAPLGMRHSIYSPPEGTPGVATVYDTTGSPIPRRRFTANAAAGLCTSASDLVRFVRAHHGGPRGEPIGRGVLAPATITAMHTPHAALYGAAVWGLGTMLFAPHDHGGYVIGHDGSDEPAVNAAVRLDPATGDAIVVLVTGNPLLATHIASEWTFWHTGAVDVLDFRQGMSRMLALLAGGAAAILGVAAFVGWRRLAGPRRPTTD